MDGDSDISPWTDWIQLKTNDKEEVLLPILILRDSNQVVETTRKVYHRKSYDKPASDRPDPMPAGPIPAELTAEIFSGKGALYWVEP
jgi:hypothetical protein